MSSRFCRAISSRPSISGVCGTLIDASPVCRASVNVLWQTTRTGVNLICTLPLPSCELLNSRNLLVMSLPATTISSGIFAKNPHAPPLVQGSGRMVDGHALADYLVEKTECFAVLQGRIVSAE